jgi:hypothetical protein
MAINKCTVKDRDKYHHKLLGLPVWGSTSPLINILLNIHNKFKHKLWGSTIPFILCPDCHDTLRSSTTPIISRTKF